jgi:hypothetical protein
MSSPGASAARRTSATTTGTATTMNWRRAPPSRLGALWRPRTERLAAGRAAYFSFVVAECRHRPAVQPAAVVVAVGLAAGRCDRLPATTSERSIIALPVGGVTGGGGAPPPWDSLGSAGRPTGLTQTLASANKLCTNESGLAVQMQISVVCLAEWRRLDGAATGKLAGRMAVEPATAQRGVISSPSQSSQRKSIDCTCRRLPLWLRPMPIRSIDPCRSQRHTCG